MIQIVDTYEEIEKLLEAGTFSRRDWERYIRRISPQLLSMVEEDSGCYDFQAQILPVLEYLFAHRELAERAHRSFLKAAEGLEERCRQVPVGSVEGLVLFYMGLCCGAGWATELEGRPAVLLGLEKIVELNWIGERDMIGLIYHELGHNWHFQNRKAERYPDTPMGRALWQLYTEGCAMWFEQFLMSDRQFYHQDSGGWLSWCRKNRNRLARIYLDRAQTGDVQDFFGDWCNFEGRSDVGYYLGGEAAGRICEEQGPAHLLDLSMEEFSRCLEELAQM